MSTKNPRFLVTIDPSKHRALKLLAGISGKSVSALINDILEPELKPLLALVRDVQDSAQLDLEDAVRAAEASLVQS